MIIYQYFICYYWICIRIIGFYKFNNFHGPDSNDIKRLVYYNPNNDKFYQLKPKIIHNIKND